MSFSSPSAPFLFEEISNAIQTLEDVVLQLSQIFGIADLFFPVKSEETRDVSHAGCTGIATTLSQAAQEIKEIIDVELAEREKEREK